MLDRNFLLIRTATSIIFNMKRERKDEQKYISPNRAMDQWNVLPAEVIPILIIKWDVIALTQSCWRIR